MRAAISSVSAFLVYLMENRVKATDFEYRHQTLLHMMVVGLSLLTYLRDRVDIVWGAIRNHPDSAWWEHLVFGIGAFITSWIRHSGDLGQRV